ncbi:Heme oxygenase family protein [Alloalcanivorax dieselolei B5]|uniref:Heme oxygenase family protein n=1 Tax=Alcanivorax dieselolei (strain DSM 16502 / CGMCC 1.3690 / MCCC 1A00001 / B-5) TaxID=930169 RepID=K0CC49_ALCDB|nr:biliverdin-producing heme oxygenase [Alloalcanivorax dieselolei]AFT71139.1 Heme oxygenase family protein [Alloalcanivorax dieselolei B5]GGJ93402.1 heme oxygenase [Alloalcanivorax dieselolei]
MTQADTVELMEKPLSLCLKEGTHQIHENLDNRLSGFAPFADEQSYRRFLRMQLRLQCATAPLYQAEELQKLFPGLAERSRLPEVEADCRDLKVSDSDLSFDRLAGTTALITGMPAAVGWLYTNEGSNLGAAFLFKLAQDKLGLSESHGARHLAGHPDGRGLHWKRFKAQLDALAFTDEDKAQAVRGAREAFAFVNSAVEELMADLPRPA